VTPSGFVWAVDPGVGRVAFAFAPVDGGLVRAETLRTDSQARDGRRLGWLDRQVRIAARQWAGDLPPAGCWVKQPAPPSFHELLPLAYAAGVVQAALFETLGCEVLTMRSFTFRRWAMGAPRASRADVLAWVTLQGVPVRSQDEANAVAVALAGRAMLLSGSSEMAA
jgi:Holliday junction resolvasome RuvABC endonuclease subunit